MISELAIIPECYVDTNLIETLVPPHRGYNHQKGCGTVTKVMQKDFADSFAIGIIDKDKQQVDYLKEFKVVIEKGSLTLHKHPQKHHYIIQINPAIERFLMKAANATGISLSDHDLPEVLASLTKISKSVSSKTDNRFKKLVRAIRNVGYDEFTTLTNWITYLTAFGYDSDMNELKDYDN